MSCAFFFFFQVRETVKLCSKIGAVQPEWVLVTFSDLEQDAQLLCYSIFQVFSAMVSAGWSSTIYESGPGTCLSLLEYF